MNSSVNSFVNAASCNTLHNNLLAGLHIEKGPE
jgi:hypothetical protein